MDFPNFASSSMSAAQQDQMSETLNNLEINLDLGDERPYLTEPMMCSKWIINAFADTVISGHQPKILDFGAGRGDIG